MRPMSEAVSAPKTSSIPNGSCCCGQRASSAGPCAGKPEANYIVERAIEAAARQVGCDPAGLRRQNLIASFPHKTALGIVTIDSGNFVANLDQAVARADARGFEARRAEAKARGKLR